MHTMGALSSSLNSISDSMAFSELSVPQQIIHLLPVFTVVVPKIPLSLHFPSNTLNDHLSQSSATVHLQATKLLWTL